MMIQLNIHGEPLKPEVHAAELIYRAGEIARDNPTYFARSCIEELEVIPQPKGEDTVLKTFWIHDRLEHLFGFSTADMVSAIMSYRNEEPVDDVLLERCTADISSAITSYKDFGKKINYKGV